MVSAAAKTDIIQQLKKELLSLQGYKHAAEAQSTGFGLGPVEMAFPGRRFPTGAVHEFLSDATENAAATNGFIAGLLGKLMQSTGVCLWVSTRRTLFPPALKLFGIAPERIIFIDLAKPKEALWVVEEALKCEALAAVVGEISELSFTQSRRLQLAVEQSRVTGFIHRCNPRTENTVACLTRWKIKPIASATDDGMPGVGFPRWNVQLLKVRNGKPGTWQMEWSAGGFQQVPQQDIIVPGIPKRKAG